MGLSEGLCAVRDSDVEGGKEEKEGFVFIYFKNIHFNIYFHRPLKFTILTHRILNKSPMEIKSDYTHKKQ